MPKFLNPKFSDPYPNYEGPLGPWGGLRSKCCRWYNDVRILCKNAKFKDIYLYIHIYIPSGTHQFVPQYFGPYPKKLVQHFFSPMPEVSQKGMSNCSRIKTQGGDRFWRNGLFLALSHTPETSRSETPLNRVGLVLKISSTSIYSIKSYINVLLRTGRQTLGLTSIYRCMKFLCPFWYLLLQYVCSLHSDHEGNTLIWANVGSSLTENQLVENASFIVIS